VEDYEDLVQMFPGQWEGPGDALLQVLDQQTPHTQAAVCEVLNPFSHSLHHSVIHFMLLLILLIKSLMLYFLGVRVTSWV